jgi:hypothetical protein
MQNRTVLIQNDRRISRLRLSVLAQLPNPRRISRAARLRFPERQQDTRCALSRSYT